MNIIEVTHTIRKIRLKGSMELLDLISKLDHLMKDFSNGMFVVGATLDSNESFDFRDDPELLKIHQDTLLAASAVAEKAFEENLLSKEYATKFADAFTVADYIRINPKPTTESKEKRMLDIKNPFFIDDDYKFDEIAKIITDTPSIIKNGADQSINPMLMMSLLGCCNSELGKNPILMMSMMGKGGDTKNMLRMILTNSDLPPDIAENMLSGKKLGEEDFYRAMRIKGFNPMTLKLIESISKGSPVVESSIKPEIDKIKKFLGDSKDFGIALSSTVNLGISQNENLDANLKTLFDALNIVTPMHSYSQTFISFLKTLKLGNGINDILAAIIDDASTMDALFKAESISGMYFRVAPDANDYKSILNIVLLLDEGTIGVPIKSILNRNVDSPARLMWILTTKKSFIDEYAKIKFEISEKDVSKIMAKAVEFVEKANAKAPRRSMDDVVKSMQEVSGTGVEISIVPKIGGKKQTDDSLVKHFEEAALSYAISFKNLEAIGERIIMSTKDIDTAADAIDKILEQTEQKLHNQFTHLREGIIAKKKIAP